MVNVKKIIIAMLLIFAVVCPLVSQTLGDVDNDGDVNIVDALLVAQEYVGLTPVALTRPENSDVDCGGNIDIVDALLIAQFYVGLITEFAPCTINTPEPTPQSKVVVFAVNCGGRDYIASDGTRYEADAGFAGGVGYDNGASVSGTDDQPLYSTERYGDTSYSVKIPNGKFLVTLHFAENYHTSTGSRSFNVLLEDKVALNNLDIYSEVGANRAYVVEKEVEVTDGELNIDFVTVLENALVNAIKVTSISFSGEPVVDFTLSPNIITLEEPATVDASASYDPDGTIVSYDVDYGDGFTARGVTTSHQYTREGSYTIKVTVTDNDGKSSTLDKDINVLKEKPQCTETRPANPRRGTYSRVDRSAWASGVPSEINMYIYVPGDPSSKPPIVVAAHSCSNSAQGMSNQTPGIRATADRVGFILIYPDNSQKNCWDVGSSRSLTHDGGGDTQAIAQMVQYALRTYNGDKDRVYIFGGSSGAMMTQAMMAVYPNLFKAGSAMAGVPAGCWADGYSSSNQWSGNCAGGRTIKSAQQWGDQARAMYRGYDGPRPRVHLSHGTADTTISYNNMNEAVKQWTNVLGLSETPSSQDTITTASLSYNRKLWKDDCGYIILEAWSSPGTSHSMPYEESVILEFFGLNDFNCFDPQVLACPD